MGMRVHLVDVDFYDVPQVGKTALITASSSGHLDAVHALLTSGADKEARDKVEPLGGIGGGEGARASRVSWGSCYGIDMHVNVGWSPCPCDLHCLSSCRMVTLP